MNQKGSATMLILLAVAIVLIGGGAWYYEAHQPAATTTTQSAPTIDSVNPTSGPVGTTVTITGSGFAPTGNAIEFSGKAAVDSVDSSNGTTITFTIPGALYLLCSITTQCPSPLIPIQAGSYDIAVYSNSQLSNSEAFTVR